jgi:predicted GNAT family N-acyltransferase
MQITTVKIEDKQRLAIVWQIRKTVFVEEQGVDESLEYEYEEESNHYLAVAEGFPVGTARWRKTDKGIKLERFAVLKAYRNKGVGASLLANILAESIPLESKIYLHAQETAVAFYANYGFTKQGNAFIEADINHFLMVFDTSTGFAR